MHHPTVLSSNYSLILLTPMGQLPLQAQAWLLRYVPTGCLLPKRGYGVFCFIYEHSDCNPILKNLVTVS